MRARDLLGKKLVGIKQERVDDGRGAHHYHLAELRFEGGAVLVFTVQETERADYLIVGHVLKGAPLRVTVS